jgi:hypothetical protein
VAAFTALHRPIHGAHTLAALPRHFLERALATAQDTWGSRGLGWEWRAPLSLLALLGLLQTGGHLWFGLASVLGLLVGYLVFAHTPDWTLYYQETQPVLAYATALGAAKLLARAAGERRDRDVPARAVAPLALALLLVLGPGLLDAEAMRGRIALRTGYFRQAARVFARIPEPRAIVFVRYRPPHSPHWSLVQNPADYARARLWLVHDRGPDNLRLMRLAPERAAYLFDEASFSLHRLPPVANP